MEVERPKYGFEELDVYKNARSFRIKIYALSKSFPLDEKFNLISQIRRAALSLTNNIAEGHGRFHFQENIQYLRQSRGSLEEIIDDLNTCLDERYITEQIINDLKNEAYSLLKQLNGYILYLRNRKQQSDEN